MAAGLAATDRQTKKLTKRVSLADHPISARG